MQRDRRPSRAAGDFASWCLLTLMALLFLTLKLGRPFHVIPESTVLPGLGLIVLAACIRLGRARGQTRLVAAATAFLQLTASTVLALLLSYVVAARGGPQWDAQLASWDSAIGIDWDLVRAAVDASGALTVALGIAYHGLIPQMIVVVVALSSLAMFDRLRVVVAAAILSGLVTVLISGLMPAIGNLFDPSCYHHLWTPIPLRQTSLLTGLRDGSLRSIDLGALEGIITFPSYHAALAAIFIYAFAGVRILILPGTLWAAFTIAATPLVGGHYAADVFGGVALAIVCVWVARPLVRFQLTASSRISALGRGGAVACPPMARRGARPDETGRSTVFEALRLAPARGHEASRATSRRGTSK